MLHYWICHLSQPAPSERQQFFLPAISLHKFPSIQKQSLVTRVLHLCHQGKQEAKKQTRVQNSMDNDSKVCPKALNLLLITVTVFSFSYINYLTCSYILVFAWSFWSCTSPCPSGGGFGSPGYPSLCVVIYNDDTCPWALLTVSRYKRSRQGWIAFHICCPDVLQFSLPLWRD